MEVTTAKQGTQCRRQTKILAQFVEAWESVSLTLAATPKRGSPYPQLEGPHRSVGIHIPKLKGHTEAWESVSPTPSSSGYGLPRFGMAPRVGDMGTHASVWPFTLRDMDTHASVWPLNLGIWTPIVWCGPSSSGYELPRFGGSVDLGIWTPTLRCGPSSWGYGLPRFGVALAVGDMDTHASLWTLESGIQTPTLRCGTTSWGYGYSRFGVAPRVGDTDSHALV